MDQPGGVGRGQAVGRLSDQGGGLPRLQAVPGVDQLGQPRTVRARNDREFRNGDVELLAAAPRDVDVDVGWRLRSHR